jgi:predicted sulfurtransferase
MDRSVKSSQVLRVLNIAFYHFVNLEDPQKIRQELKGICSSLGLKGSILVSSEGMNGFLAGAEEPIRQFQAHLKNEALWSSITFKESISDRVPFQRLLIKLKKEIIPLGDPNIQPHHFTAPRLSPQELKHWLEEGKDFLLLDTRNDYEVKYGTFEKATLLEIQHFRDFPEKLHQIPDSEKKKPVVMFCTGGIRCEKASVVALNQGFQEVYQLEGGILNYFEECGGSHYEGNCFVFDERVALDPQLKPTSNLLEKK